MEEEKFKNKFQIKSSRLAGYDYSQNGMYFVTICVKNREESLGEVRDGKMTLSDIGKAAERCWMQIPEHFTHVVLDIFQIMPNHIHGIIEINWNIIGTSSSVETQNFASLQKDDAYKNKFGPQFKNLSLIIRGFKVGVKKYTTKNEINFQWQPRFYDHIIRDEESLNKIREYIISNPETWERDRNNPENIYM